MINKKGISPWIWIVLIVVLVLIAIVALFLINGGDPASIIGGANSIPQPPALPN